MMDGEFPHELRGIFAAYEVQSNPWGLPADTRGDWAAAADVPILRTRGRRCRASTTSSTSARPSRSTRAARRSRSRSPSILRAAGVRFAILGARETSTGECVRRAGNEMLFQQLAATLVATLSGVRHPAHRDLRSARLQLAEERIPGLRRPLRSRPPHAAHRAAHRRRADPAAPRLRARDLPRALLPRPPQRRVRGAARDHPGARRATRRSNSTLAREKAMCCGAGGGRMWIDETIGKRINIAARRAGAAEGARRHRHRLPLLRGDDVRRHQGAGKGRARSRRATSPSWWRAR